ncbi:MAG: protein kinase [Planctomycetota bacterium]|nr:protein kinase [Planctomycetota bacterium]
MANSTSMKTPKEVQEIARCKRLQRSLQQLFESNPLFSPHATVAFETLEKLGEGGMGSVFRVRDHRMNRQAALKVLLGENPELRHRERFMREARITARLDHPTIPAVYEAGSTKDNQVFMLMKVIEGDTLEDKIQHYHDNDCPSSELRQLLEVLAKVAEAMAYTHSEKILHRDLKPANIMVGRFGEVLVMDWGLAKEMNSPDLEAAYSEGMPDAHQFEDNGLTLSGSIIGTPGYMSPEQASGEEIDALTDVFALGITLTRILTGVAPIQGDSVIEKIVATVKGWIYSPEDLKADVPPELNSLAILATQAEPSKRLPSALQLKRELLAYLAGEELESHSYSRIELMKRKVSRNPRSLISLLFATLLFSVLTFSLGEYFVVQAASDLALLNQREADSIVQSKKDIQATKLAVANAERKAAQREAVLAAQMLALFDKAKALSRRGGNEEELIELVEKAMELGGRDYIALMTAAEIYERAGMKDQLPSLLNEAVGKHEKPYGALYFQHLLENEKSGDFLYTKPLIQLVELSKNNGESNEFTLFQQSFQLYKQHRYDEAQTKIKHAISISPKSLFFQTQGLIYEALKNNTSALVAFKKALAAQPTSSHLKCNVAQTLMKLNRRPEAEKICKLILKSNENHEYANLIMGGIVYERGEFTQAIQYLGKVTPSIPPFETAHLALGNSFKKTGELNKAINCYTTLIQKSKSANAFRNRALCYKLKRNWIAAANDYSEYLRIFSPDVGASRELGYCLIKAKRPIRAYQVLSGIIGRFPRDIDAIELAALACLVMKKYKQTLIHCNQALKSGSKNLVIPSYRAESYFYLKNYRQALIEYQSLLTKLPPGKRRENINACVKLCRQRMHENQ